MQRLIPIVLIVFFQQLPLFSQRLVINEIMSQNTSTIADNDHDFPDWIEIYNADSIAANLSGFGLSDDSSLPFKWTFPAVALPAKSCLLVFASGKDIRALPAHWETVIDWGDDWKYLVPAAEPPTDWRSASFDDSAWPSGPSGFGYGDGDDATLLANPDPFQPSPVSVFIRKKFTVTNLADIVRLVLHVDFDDGFVAYLNGTELARGNMRPPGKLPAFDDFAAASHEAQMYRGGAPEPFVIAAPDSFLLVGDNYLALEVHNAELYSSDLTLIPFLTLEMKAPPEHGRGASRHLQFPSLPLQLHTNFKIKASGEMLRLTNPYGQICDQIAIGLLPPDISFGRQPDGAANWYFFDQPTPALSNTRPGYQQIAEPPSCSLPGGFYNQPQQVELMSAHHGAVIRYTLDGSLPSENSSSYDSPVLITKTTVLRARVFGSGLLPGATMTQTYFINQSFSLPVISLVTDPANLWDVDKGIYVFGKHADTLNYPYWGANFWQDWERPIHLEFFESNGVRGFDLDAGVQIFGSWSRLYPQKSLAIFARSNYGADAIRYPIFQDKPIASFQSLILRNSGQDWGRTFFRDAMMQFLVRATMDLDIQAYRPAMVFLNGQLWGIHNIREKMNEHYLASNRRIDPENIDFVERDSLVIKGDLWHYQHLLQFVATNDLAQTEHYDYVRSLMDVENFMDYTIAVIYFANPDWPWNNVKCWRPRTANGRWKWLLYDLDYGFHGGHLGPEANMFREMRHQTNGTTALFFQLLQNSEYRRQFIDRFADHLNITFEPARVLQIIKQFQAGIAADMPSHITRWKGTFNGPWWLGKSIDSMDEWYSHISVLNDFAQRRPDFLRKQLLEEFGLVDGGIAIIKLNTQPALSGQIRLNSQLLHQFPWYGIYFPDVPIDLSAIPAPGFRFSHWIGLMPSDQSAITTRIADRQEITAVFLPDTAVSGSIVVTEINYQSHPATDAGDWIELYNRGATTIDLSGWIFLDAEDQHRFRLPPATIITPQSYLVLCQNQLRFLHQFPEVHRCVGDFSFGLSSNGDSIRVVDALGNRIIAFVYGTQTPWPEAANGSGKTLALKHPDLSPALPQNWAASNQVGGTPGAPNDLISATQHNAPVPSPIFDLFPIHPNPFNSSTKIEFSLAQPQAVSLQIYNLLGQAIRVLCQQPLPAGKHAFYWNGSDFSGQDCPSGIYFCRLTTDSQQLVRKMVLIR